MILSVLSRQTLKILPDACVCVSWSPDGCRDDQRASICRTMRLLLRESVFLLRFLLLLSLGSHLCTFAGHILEHSEDDTKSLFVIIQVCAAPCQLLMKVKLVSRCSSPLSDPQRPAVLQRNPQERV